MVVRYSGRSTGKIDYRTENFDIAPILRADKLEGRLDQPIPMQPETEGSRQAHMN